MSWFHVDVVCFRAVSATVSAGRCVLWIARLRNSPRWVGVLAGSLYYDGFYVLQNLALTSVVLILKSLALMSVVS